MVPFTTIDSNASALLKERVWDARRVPLIRSFFSGLVLFSICAGGSILQADAKPVESRLRGCNFLLTLPSGYIIRQETPTVILARSRTGEDLIVSCLPNAKMTSRHEQLVAALRKEGDEIWSEEKIQAGPLPGILYLRRGLEMGKPIERAEGYAAARHFEIRVSLLYATGSPKSMERLADVRKIFQSIAFTGVVGPTITEGSYQIRLAAIIGLVASGAAGVTIVLWKRRRRKRVPEPSIREDAPGPESPE